MRYPSLVFLGWLAAACGGQSAGKGAGAGGTGSGGTDAGSTDAGGTGGVKPASGGKAGSATGGTATGGTAAGGAGMGGSQSAAGAGAVHAGGTGAVQAGGTGAQAGQAGAAAEIGGAGVEEVGGAAGSAGVCPSQWECEGEYPGSFECFCTVGEYTHPIGCDTTLADARETVAAGGSILREYAECGLAVLETPIGYDGAQLYAFDLETGALVGSLQTSDHGPSCSAGRLPEPSCAVTACSGDIGNSPVATGCRAECPLPPEGTSPGAYPTTFRFAAPPGQTLYLRNFCELEVSLRACSDEYAHSLGRPFCMGECPATDCPLCGQCTEEIVAVTETDSVDWSWSGQLYELRDAAAGCDCYVQHPVTPGRYSVSIPVYASEQEALEEVAAFTTTREFELSAADGVVEVVLE